MAPHPTAHPQPAESRRHLDVHPGTGPDPNQIIEHLAPTVLLDCTGFQPIAQTWTRGGWRFRVLRREGDVVLVAKSKRNLSRAFYEVAIVQRRPESTVQGRCIPAAECMPRNEDWGTYAWSPFDRRAAELKFRQRCLWLSLVPPQQAPLTVAEGQDSGQGVPTRRTLL